MHLTLVIGAFWNRQKVLTNSNEEHAPDSQKRGCDFCPTRRVLDNFEGLFTPIIFCLEEMSLNKGRLCNQDTSIKANSFYK